MYSYCKLQWRSTKVHSRGIMYSVITFLASIVVLLAVFGVCDAVPQSGHPHASSSCTDCGTGNSSLNLVSSRVGRMGPDGQREPRWHHGNEWEGEREQWQRPDKGSKSCIYPCSCENQETICKVGVSTIKDGCQCCYMCARQQGDLCSYRDKCDEEKELYCDRNLDPHGRGICRARAGKPCEVNGQQYKDGQEFRLKCNQQCTCQDGQYACTPRCPQEERMPSLTHCKHPRLIQIGKECCKEWICPQQRHLPLRPEGPANGVSTVTKKCVKDTSPWSTCSTSCGVGVSTRITKNQKCDPLKEHRLCLVRPCDLDDQNMEGRGCKSMVRGKPEHIEYEECKTIRPLRLKYCSTCKKGKCCWPRKSKTIEVLLKCPDKRIITRNFMYVRSCECYKPSNCPFQ